jgi:HAMP domain-containing protein
MKLKVFLIVLAGSMLMLAISAALVFVQVRSVRSVDLSPLADSLYQEDARILSFILASVDPAKIDSLRLPPSWAEIFLVNTPDLQLTASTEPSHRGMPLYRHPQLLDQAEAITGAIRKGAASTVSTPGYMVVMQPQGSDSMIIALKPKAWEKGLVAKQEQEITSRTYRITLVLGIFLAVGLILSLALAWVVSRTVAGPVGRALDALEALSLGDFDHDLDEKATSEMGLFVESYLRVKTSLEMALDMIARR